MKLQFPPKRGVTIAFALTGVLLLAGCIRSVLKNADQFVILAGGTLSASAPVEVGGSIGAGIGINNVTGTDPLPGASVTQALADLASTQAKLRAVPAQEITPAALLAFPVHPGFYHVTGSLTIPASQTLTLDGDGVYVFNVDSALTVGNAATVVGTNGAQPANVFFNAASASFGSGVEFGGVVVTEGNITVGAETGLLSKLLSRTGNVFLDATSTVIDPLVFSGGYGPAIALPAMEYTVAPGQPVTFPVSASVLIPTSTEVALFAKDLPSGATQTPNVNGVDSVGPNGSDLLATGAPILGSPVPPTAASTFSWTPTVPGTYKVTYFARAIGESVGTVTTRPVTESLPYNSAIDVCTVTIRVVDQSSTPGQVTGSGSFGSGPSAGTFSISVASQASGPNARVAGSARFTLTSPRLSFQADSFRMLRVTDLGGGRKQAVITGLATITRQGQVPFQVIAVDGGTTPTLDAITITLQLNPALNNGASTLTFGGEIGRRAGSIQIR